jgi:hypothetical protein
MLDCPTFKVVNNVCWFYFKAINQNISKNIKTRLHNYILGLEEPATAPIVGK